MNSCTKKRSCGMAILAIIGLLLAAGGAYGQSAGFANINGRVIDPKGATVPDAMVTAINVDTGISRTTTTTSDGIYRFENLQPGVYDIAVDASGFAKFQVKGVRILVGETRDVNATMVLSGQVSTVLVTSEVPLVETTKTDVSINLDDRDVADLPTTTSFGGLGGVANDWQGLEGIPSHHEQLQRRIRPSGRRDPKCDHQIRNESDPRRRPRLHPRAKHERL